MQTSIAPTPKGSVHVKKQISFMEDPVIYQVRQSCDYRKFKMLADNRTINQLHVKRLVDSFKNQYLVCPIICNELFEIIDGQHRLRAAQESDLPVNYIMINGYGMKEVQLLNTNQKNWTKIDYLLSYVSYGKKPYVEFHMFMKDFPELSFQACERILTGKGNGQRQGTFSGKKFQMRDFEEGKLIIPDLSKSYSLARKIMEFKPYYEGFGKGMFATTMMSLFRSKNYNHKEMLHKLSTGPIKLADCRIVEEYKLLLENIYNYKRLKENKVSFRYEQ
jgi:hypothetical protein